MGILASPKYVFAVCNCFEGQPILCPAEAKRKRWVGGEARLRSASYAVALNFVVPAEAGTKLVEVAGVEPDRRIHLLSSEIHFSTFTSTLQNYKGALKCSKMQENEQKSANLLQIRD